MDFKYTFLMSPISYLSPMIAYSDLTSILNKVFHLNVLDDNKVANSHSNGNRNTMFVIVSVSDYSGEWALDARLSPHGIRRKIRYDSIYLYSSV